MRTTIVVIVAAIGLICSASGGTAQVKGDKKSSRWQGSLICSKNQGKGKLSFTLNDDSTYSGKWEVNCLGYRVLGSGVGAYKFVGADISFVATGSARADIGATSRSTINFSGKIIETTGSGTYRISFEEDEWPLDEYGIWNVEKVK